MSNYLDVKFAMMWHLRGLGGGEEVEHWPFYEYEHHAKKLADTLEKEKKAREGKDSGSNQLRDPRSDANGMLQKAKSGMKMPDMSRIKVPKF